MLTESTVCFEFAGLHRPGICAIERILLSDARTLVICTELDDNPCMSVTNAAELIATQVCQQFGLTPESLVWVEHYPPGRAYGLKPDWDLVTFQLIRHGEYWRFEEPYWRPVQDADWQAFGLEPRR